MTLRILAGSLVRLLAVVIFGSAISPNLFAQGPGPSAPSASIEPTPPITMPAPRAESSEHRFWDKENAALFAASAAMSAADFTVTRQNLQSGGRELNPIVRVFGRSTPGLAANFIGETVGGIGLSYFFHKTHHHNLERAVSMFNIGSSAGAVTYGLTHR